MMRSCSGPRWYRPQPRSIATLPDHVASRIVKIRRSTFSCKRLSKRSLFRKQDGGSLMSELGEVAYQMSLTVVTTLNSNWRPRTIAAFNGSKHLLKSYYSTEQPGTKPDFIQITALELARAHAGIIRELVHRYQ